MTVSLPSKKISIVDVPEVSNFNGKFYYNFFTSDERVNENGTAPLKYLEKSSEKFDTKLAETVDFNRSIPRYIQFNWKPVNVGNNKQLANISIKNNYDKLYFEDEFSLGDFVSLDFQDTNVDQRLSFIVKKAIKNLKSFDPSKPKSLQENLKLLNKETSEDVTGEYLQIGLNPQTTGISFFDSNGEKIESQIVQNLKSYRAKISVNNKVIHDLVSAGAYDEVISPFADELEDFVGNSEKVQQLAIKARDSSLVDSSEYEFELDKIISKKAVDPNRYEPILQTIGYIIEKEELTENGKVIKLPPFFIENPNINSTVDFRLKYDSSYRYKIRTVAYVELQAVEESLGMVAGIGILIASKASPAVVVKCSEYLAPPPPTDFNIYWDYSKNELKLVWAFPINPQQDIKKFQIFRRKEINEPYQLIKMYDFDDSLVKTKDNERPYPELVQKTEFPILMYVDREFTKNSKFIYSLCSIDAHGFSSGYSTQWEISFDTSKNKLVKKLVSVGGAPKAYPNAFINQDTFVDTIKSEWNKKVKIYFNPEYLRIYNNDDTDLKLIKAKETDKYLLKLINIDLQKDQDIVIKIKDLTKNQRLSINNKKVYPVNPDIIEEPRPTELQTDNNGRWVQGSGKNSFKIGS